MAGVDEAVADAMLQRDLPAPTGFVRDRARVRYRGARRFNRHGYRAVAGQPVGPVLVAGLQGLLDQQAAEARAVDEQVAFDELAVFQHSGDEACFGILPDVTDLPLDALEAVALGEVAQEARVQPASSW